MSNQKKKTSNKEESEPKQSDLSILNLKGKVKSINQSLYRAHLKSGYIEQGEWINFYGNDRNFKMSFDENGNKVSEEYFWMENHSHKEIFNKDGLKIESQNIENGILKFKSLFFYNENKKYSNLISYNEELEKSSESKYEYDENGNNSIIRYFDKDGELTTTYYLKYDENGHKIEDKRIKADGTIEFWMTLKNYEHDYATQTNYLSPDGSIHKTEIKAYIYDKDGKCISYNGIKQKSEANLENKELEFDKYGNWIIRAKLLKEIPIMLCVREINYHGEESQSTLIKNNPESKLIIMYEMEKTNEEKQNVTFETRNITVSKSFEFTIEQAQWLSESATHETFPAVKFYALLHKEIPSSVIYSGQDIEAIALMKELQKSMNALVVHTFNNEYYSDGENRLIKYTLAFPNKPYIIQAINIQMKKESEYELPYMIEDYYDDFDGYVRISPILLFHPSDASGNRDMEFEQELKNCINICTLEKMPDKPEISMVEVTHDGKFKLSTFAVHDNFTIKDLDMHYGYGFEKFHNELMQRFRTDTRGLVLFHGSPGTGKTYYIRHLLRKMTMYNKMVIYMPPNMVEKLIDPVFITFLSKEISKNSKLGVFCVLLVEDAEPLLASRQGDVRVQGISNLLNLTDGLLNDMLKLQIICTFNVKVKELDKALLRPGRLIARKEFKAMSVLDANRLAQHLGLKHHFTKPTTLAEVYSMCINMNTLIHGDGDNYSED